MPAMTSHIRSSALFLSISLAAVAACSTSNAPSKKAAAPASAEVEVVGPTHTHVSADVRATVARVDALLAAAWSQTGVEPAPAADDPTFLRRASMDLVGDLPEASAAAAFAADGAEDKRSKLLTELSKSAGWARHWTNVFDELWMLEGRNPLVDRVAFRQWLYGALRSGTSYDALVREMLTAKGTNSEGGRPDMTAWEPSDGAAPEGVNGAVNWFLQGSREPQDLAGLASRTMLGVQLQCAECHDHPTEKWTQNDFKSFTSTFLHARGKRLDKGRAMGIRRVAVQDSRRVPRARMRKTGYGKETPTALDGTKLDTGRARDHLAEWMTAADNPWFAKAMVNRMWSQFLGRGFIEPIDDFRADQEVVLPEVLDVLVQDFVAHGYDLGRLMRIMLSTEAYARSAVGREPAKMWEHFALRPMTDTQLLDAIVRATGIEPVLEEVAGERLPRIKMRLRKQFRFAFDVDEAGSDDGFTGTVPQALMLLNGPVTAAGSSALEASTVGRAARLPGGATAALDAIYLAALGRTPAAEEREHWLAYIASADPSDARRARGGGPVGRVYRQKRLPDVAAEDEAYEDIMWALLNSSEFFFIH
jgi:Protein of unknown function (DUF1549)/Protein of unknown function (DUF1553)